MIAKYPRPLVKLSLVCVLGFLLLAFSTKDAFAVSRQAHIPSLQQRAKFLTIVCGGIKTNSPGHTWRTYYTGGYPNAPCGAGIDYIPVPAPNASSTYGFNYGDGSLRHFQAWIPTVHATATVGFTLYACGQEIRTKAIYEKPVSGWQDLYTVSTNYLDQNGHSCFFSLVVSTDAVTSGYEMGADAIRALVV